MSLDQSDEWWLGGVLLGEAQKKYVDFLSVKWRENYKGMYVDVRFKSRGKFGWAG